jgi:hypothetical protein
MNSVSYLPREAHCRSPRSFVARLFVLLALMLPWQPLAEVRGATGPVEVIPITQFKIPYFYYTEDGNGVTCGAYLQGSFPVFKNYTNLSSYTLNITGLNGWSGIRSWNERNPGSGVPSCSRRRSPGAPGRTRPTRIAAST